MRGNKFSATGVSPKWVKSRSRRRRKKEREKSRWKQWPASLRPPPRVAHASMPGPIFWLQLFKWLPISWLAGNPVTRIPGFVPPCLRAPHLVADEAKLAIVGPGVLACATRGGGRSEAGHCFHLLFSFFLSFFFFFLLRLLLFTHFGESPVRENLFPPIFWHN